MLMNFDKLILPQGISPITNGGKRKSARKLSRKLRSKKHKKNNKSTTRRCRY